MVVYHSLNYTNQHQLAFRYLSFLPPSFILITGYLIVHVYSPRYDLDRRQIVARLLLRGVKILTLFTVLNIVAQFVRSPAYGESIGIENFFHRWDGIFIF